MDRSRMEVEPGLWVDARRALWLEDTQHARRGRFASRLRLGASLRRPAPPAWRPRGFHAETAARFDREAIARPKSRCSAISCIASSRFPNCAPNCGGSRMKWPRAPGCASSWAITTRISRRCWRTSVWRRRRRANFRPAHICLPHGRWDPPPMPSASAAAFRETGRSGRAGDHRPRASRAHGFRRSLHERQVRLLSGQPGGPGAARILTVDRRHERAGRALFVSRSQTPHPLRARHRHPGRISRCRSSRMGTGVGSKARRENTSSLGKLDHRIYPIRSAALLAPMPVIEASPRWPNAGRNHKTRLIEALATNALQISVDRSPRRASS